MATAREKIAEGLRVRQKEKEGKLTTYGRRGLAASDYALPPDAEARRRGFKGRYPIDTIERARNALARVSQFGTAAEKAAVKRAVRRKYPDIEIGA